MSDRAVSGSRTSRLKRRSTGVLVGTALVVASFVAYFVLIVYCDLNRPEAFGAKIRAASGGFVVETVEFASPASRGGLRPGDRLVAAAGQPLRGALDWNAAMARIEIDRELSLEIEREGRRLASVVTFHPADARWWRSPEGMALLLFRVVQLLTLLIAVALAARPTGLTGQLGAGVLATIGVYCLALPYRLATIWRVVPVAGALLFWLPLISTLVIGGTLFAFFSSFPQPRHSARRLLALCSPFTLVIVWEGRFIAAAVYGREPVSAVPDLMPWVVAINVAYLSAGVVALVRNYQLLREPDQRRRIRLVVAGSCIGTAAGAVPVLAYWLGLESNLSAMYTPSPVLLVAFGTFLVMPVAFWHAIVRHQLFDLRSILRRGMTYAFARQAVLAVGPLALTAMTLDAASHSGEPLGALVRRHLWWYAAGLVSVGALQIWRRQWLDYLDRRLFRDRYDACSVLRAAVSEVRLARELRVAAPAIVAQIDAALHPRWTALFVRARGDERFHSVASLPSSVGPWPARTRLLDFVRALQKPLDVDLPDADWVVDRLPDHEVDSLDDSGAHLIVPVVMDAAAAEAMIVLGRKRSDEPFDREDKALLQGIAESLADMVGPYVASLTPTAAAHPDRDEFWLLPPEIERRLEGVVSAVSQGLPVEWSTEASGAPTELEQRMLGELQTLARIGDLHRQCHDESDVPGRRWGPFHLREAVGSGSFGTVYRAWDPRLDQEVAIKLLSRQPAGSRSRFEEGRLLARVRHPNVVSVYGADEHDGVTGVWMEFVRGQTLKALIHEQGVFGGHEAALIGTMLARALAAVHRAGLLHQDIKAQNVMRERGGRIVLMDFGAGVGTAEAAPSGTGTPIYMAPELFSGSAASPESDLYALGVLLFHMVTGAFPVEGTRRDQVERHHALGTRLRLRDLRPDLPDNVVAAIERAIDVDPSRRFATPGALELALARGDR